MAQPHLRIYYGPEQSVAAEASAQNDTQIDRVTVQLSDVFPLLADAVRGERTWLKDFAEDEITISSDLYEVLLAYQHYCRRPSA
jgi:hypothetical protein